MSAFFNPSPEASSSLTYSWTDRDIETASIAAVNFGRAFYESYDKAADRLPLLAPFYRERSVLTWNGNRATGIVEIGETLSKIPPSSHDVGSIDCTPMAGTFPPRLIVTVTGFVRHVPPSQLSAQSISYRSLGSHVPLDHMHEYPIPTTNGAAATNIKDTGEEYVIPNPVQSSLQSSNTAGGKNKGKEMLDETTIKGLPRTFVQVFELGAENEGTGEAGMQPSYYILRDTFRFVG